VLDGRELRTDDGQRLCDVAVLVGLGNLHDAMEDLQRPSLRRAQAETTADAIHVAAHLLFPPSSIPAKRGSSCIAEAFLRRRRVVGCFFLLRLVLPFFSPSS